ncbi:MAG: baseplate J/gp47 family protein [Chloroflexi bacterium]|nr:baseplate J/gp47 family protein [Chloroflexota bacterium]
MRAVRERRPGVAHRVEVPESGVYRRLDYGPPRQAVRRPAGAGRSVVFERLTAEGGAPRSGTWRLPRSTGAPAWLWRESVSRQATAAVVGGLASILLVVVAFQYFVVPSSTITVVPQAQRLPIDATVRIDPDAGVLDVERGIVPATVMDATVSETLTKPTTGRRREAQGVAKGFVTVRNRTRQAVVLPVGSRVMAADGTGFLTDAEFLVPPTLQVGGRDVPGEAIVAVTAEAPGLAGNAPALAITTVDGPFGGALEAFNPQPLEGGSESEVALVSPRDFAELEELLTERLQSSAIERLRRDRPANQTLIVWSPATGNPQILRRDFSAEPDAHENEITLSMEIRALGTAFSTDDLEAVLRRRLQDSLEGRPFEIDSVQVVDTEVLGERQGVLDLRVQAIAEAVDTIDHNTVRETAAGRSLGEGLQALRSLPGVHRVSVTHDPPDTGNFPRISFRIDVQVEAPQPVQAP